MNQTKKAILIGCEYHFCHLVSLVDDFDGEYSLEEYSALSVNFVYYNRFTNAILTKTSDRLAHIQLKMSLNNEKKFEAYFISENEYIFIECMMQGYQKLAKLQNQYNKMQEMSLAEADEFVAKLSNYDIESFYV